MKIILRLKNLVKKVLHRRELVFNAGLYFTALLIGAAINLALTPFLALHLEHNDYAITGYFASFNSLLMPLISFSFVHYYMRNFFLLNPIEREKAKNTLLIALMFFSSLIALCSLAILYVYFQVNKVTLPFYPFALLSVSSVFLGCFYTFLLVDLKMHRDARKYFKIYVLQALIAAILSIVFVIVLKWGAFGKILGGTITAFIFAFFVIKKLLTRWEFQKKYFIDAISFSWPLTLAGMLGYFFTGVDRAILEGLKDIKSLGLYNIAIGITGYLALFSTALNDTFQPDIFKSIAQKNKKKTVIIVGSITALNFLPVILFILFAPFIIKVLTFGRFTDAAQYARILSLSNISSSLFYSMSSVIEGYGFTKITLFNRIIGAAISLMMFRYLINNFGFYGAAWGHVLSFVVMSIITFLFIFYKMKRKPNERLFSRLY